MLPTSITSKPQIKKVTSVNACSEIWESKSDWWYFDIFLNEVFSLSKAVRYYQELNRIPNMHPSQHTDVQLANWGSMFAGKLI